ncbi:MAG: tail fiber protein [Rhizomicrobium sp.]
MSGYYLGQISLYGFNFAPRGWATCDNQILPIAQNTALFSLLGTTYGGNGQSTFGLPDYRGRVPIGFGSSYVQGEIAGEEQVTLLATEMPTHTHTVRAAKEYGDEIAAQANSLFAVGNTGPLPGVAANFYEVGPGNVTLNPLTIGVSGSGLPHDNMMPSLTINFSIALVGIFPSRN